MRKISVLFLVSILFQSCFYIHKAREIEVYELDQIKNENSWTFVFEYKGNRTNFEKKSKSFFKIKTSYMPQYFTTDQLFPDEDLNVFIYSSRDKDVMVNLLGFIIKESLKSDDENLNRKNEDPHPDTTYYNYLHVQVTDDNGKDVLSPPSMKSKAIINKLLRYKNYLN